MAIEIEIEIPNNPEIVIDILHAGPSGLATVKNQDGDLKAELLPGDNYTVTEFDTLQQKILDTVPLTITQNILD